MAEKSWRSRVIMGSALGAAAIAVILDHTRHPLPDPEPAVVIVGLDETAGALADGTAAVVIVPCGLDESSPSSAGPCSLGAAPCALDTAPCSL